MKHFDRLTPAVAELLYKRGVDPEKLLYCVKADMDGKGNYFDQYLTFDKENLYIVTGYDRLSGKRGDLRYDFDLRNYRYIPLEKIEELYIDRYSHTARIMLKKANPENKNFGIPEEELARFSLGFSEKTDKFVTRVNKTIKGEEIDDSSLDEIEYECPKCHQRYPDPNRKYCPNCVRRSNIFKRLIGIFGEFRKQSLAVLGMIIVSAVLGLAAPYFGTALLYDEVLTVGGSLYGEVLYVVLMMAGFGLLSTIMSAAYYFVMASVTPMVVHKLRTDIFGSMQKLSLSFFSSKQTGSLMTRVDRDCFDIYVFFVDIVPVAAGNLLRIIGIAVLMVTISPIMALFMMIFFAVILGFEAIWLKGQRRHWRSCNIARRGLNRVITDALNGHRVVKCFSSEEQEIGRFGKRNGAMYGAEYDLEMRSAKLIPFQRGAYSIIYPILYLFGAYLVLDGQLALGGLMLLINYFGTAWDPLFFFIYAGNDYTRCVDAAARMFEIFDSEPSVKPPKDPVEIPDGILRGDICMKDVNFEYEAGRPIIKKLTLNIEAGKFFGIVGKTGAGKSTIINLIDRLYDVTGGEMTIDGYPIKRIPFEVLRKNIGIVSQDTYIFMGSVLDNIRYARPEATLEEVIEAAKFANCHEFITKLPQGYDTKIGSGGASLSGGERQRVSIARAIIQKPNILILDEATAAMDTRTERKIQAAVDSLKEGRTIIAIAHRLSTLRDADTLAVIENGELKETGTHDELIRKKGKYWELHRLQAEALKTIGVE